MIKKEKYIKRRIAFYQHTICFEGEGEISYHDRFEGEGGCVTTLPLDAQSLSHPHSEIERLLISV